MDPNLPPSQKAESIFDIDDVDFSIYPTDFNGSTTTLNTNFNPSRKPSDPESHYVDIDSNSSINGSDYTISDKYKDSHRLSVIAAGWIMPVNLVLNAILISDQIDIRVLDSVNIYANNTIFKLVLFFVILISTISFVFRCLEKKLVLSTMITVICCIINGFASMAYSIIYFYNTKQSGNTEFLGSDLLTSLLGSILSFLIASLLMIDYRNTQSFKMKGSGLSISQRYMQLSVLAVYGWACFGSMVFLFVERKSLYIGIYYCLVSMSTIGFGDVYPTTGVARWIFVIWTCIGIILMGIYLTTTRTVIVQLLLNKYRKQLLKLDKKRRKFENSILFSKRKESLKSKNSRSSKNSEKSEESSETKKRHFAKTKKMIFEWYYNSLMASKKDKVENPNWIKRVSRMHGSDTNSVDLIRNEVALAYSEACKQMNKRIIIATLLCMIFMLISASLFFIYERQNFTYAQALWFCFVAFTTIGYGDFTLETKSGIVVFIIVIILGVSLTTAMFALIIDRVQFALKHNIEQESSFSQNLQSKENKKKGFMGSILKKRFHNPFRKKKRDNLSD